MALAYINGVYTHFPSKLSAEFLEDLNHNARMYIARNTLCIMGDNPYDVVYRMDLSTVSDAQGQPRLYDLVTAYVVAYSNLVLCFHRGPMKKLMIKDAEPIGYALGTLVYKRDGKLYKYFDEEGEITCLPLHTEQFWIGTELQHGNVCYAGDNKAFLYSVFGFIGNLAVSHSVISGHKLVKISGCVTQLICPDGGSISVILLNDAVVNIVSNERSVIISYENGVRRLHNRCCAYKNVLTNAVPTGHAIDDDVKLNKFTNNKSARN